MKKKNITQKNIVAVDGGKTGVIAYVDHDVIVTEHEELFFYWEAKEIGEIPVRKATKKQSVEYIKGYDTHKDIERENDYAFYHHEIRE